MFEVFQSNHNGIETNLLNLVWLAIASFQSNHNGIETAQGSERSFV